MKKLLFCFCTFLMAVGTCGQPRAEYPRPQFERQDWVNLNGQWTYRFDFVGERKFNIELQFSGRRKE